MSANGSKEENAAIDDAPEIDGRCHGYFEMIALKRHGASPGITN